MIRTALFFPLVAFTCLRFSQAHAAELPAAAPGDAPWKFIQTTAATYPLRAMRSGVTHGEARVRVSIAADGRLLDALLVASSRPEFGQEALRVVRDAHYTGERVGDRLVGIVADIAFTFDVSGPVGIERRSPAPDEDPRATDEPLSYQAESLKHLDRIPAPSHVVPPVYPKEWSERSISGTATVEFYIDETGRTRTPVAIAASHSLLGASAVAAVAQWKFEPPSRRGRPVLVRAQQVFTFDPSK